MRASRLPEFVPIHDAAPYYSAADAGDLHRLSRDIRALSGLEAAIVAAFLVERRVMWPSLLHRIAARIAKLRGLTERAFWTRVYLHPKHGEKMTRALLTDAAHWALHGSDKEEADSLGGFSQREVNFIAGLIAIARHRAGAKNMERYNNG